MFLSPGVSRASVKHASAASILAAIIAGFTPSLSAQQTAPGFQLPPSEPQLVALPLPEDRGEAKLEQTLKQLGTTASMMFIVAHPDDEDGSLLTYLSRGMGVRV